MESGLDIALPTAIRLDDDSPRAHTAAPADTTKSTITDPHTRKVSVARMLTARGLAQSGTVTKSERAVTLNPKYAAMEKVRRVDEKMRPAEASQRVRLAQDMNDELKKQEQKKMRQLRWQSAVSVIKKELASIMKDVPHLSERNVTALNDLRRGSFLIMRSSKRYYIGEVLDIYKKGQSSRYGSIPRSSTLQGLSYLSLRVYQPLQIESSTDDMEDDADTDDDDCNPDFTCTPLQNSKFKYHLHTHAPVENVVYHLGSRALSGTYSKKKLEAMSASRWKTFTKPKTQAVIAKACPLPKIRIPGGKLVKK
ncbi:hypothetical protein D9619_004409 [Psilocybe cf. subviscida]|uniref:Uncharacterized protein n=1 Tax=Psilocybe cf. subviscida TaxID=2480587 RepID=A0A8H5BR44_9AGAR|nr:hypothetical protein D9619_004409 [Psilocybe cf. subviscida]